MGTVRVEETLPLPGADRFDGDLQTIGGVPQAEDVLGMPLQPLADAVGVTGQAGGDGAVFPAARAGGLDFRGRGFTKRVKS